MVSKQDILNVLAGIPDPELPVSIVDLGLVNDIQIEGDLTQIELLPTWTGCPALEMIERDVIDQVSQLDGIQECKVNWCFEPAWSPDRISTEGQIQLKAHGVTTPGCRDGQSVELTTSAIPCPYCSSRKTRIDSPFGPTRCRSIYFCDDCRNQFEHMKKVD